jgi:APA family basic amino acid/polyamine antiporter
MFLAVVPLQEILPPRQTVLSHWQQYILSYRNVNHCSDDYDFDFACNNGLIMAGARVYYTMAQDGLFFKSGSAE